MGAAILFLKAQVRGYTRQDGTPVRAHERMTPLFRDYREVRAAAADFRRTIEAEGFRVVSHVDSSSPAGGSTYMEVMDPTTGAAFGARIRFSDHSVGGRRMEQDRDFHVRDAGDMAIALHALREMRSPERIARLAAARDEMLARAAQERAGAEQRKQAQAEAEAAARSEWEAVRSAYPDEWTTRVERAPTATAREKARKEMRARWRAAQA
jgi:hypothetical protein